VCDVGDCGGDSGEKEELIDNGADEERGAGSGIPRRLARHQTVKPPHNQKQHHNPKRKSGGEVAEMGKRKSASGKNEKEGVAGKACDLPDDGQAAAGCGGHASLLPEADDGVKPRRLISRIQTRNKCASRTEQNAQRQKPPRKREDLHLMPTC